MTDGGRADAPWPRAVALWRLRLLVGELAALSNDWAHVTGPAPGHDFRAAVARAHEAIAAARHTLDAGRVPAPDWSERVSAHLRAARRPLTRRQLAYFGPRVSRDRRYFS